MALELFGRDTDNFAVITKIHVASDAEVALTAVNRGIEGYPVPNHQVLHVRAETGYFTSGFMAHNQGRIATPGRAVHAMHVGAADPAGPYAHEDLVRSNLGNRKIHHFQLHVFGKK